MKKAMIVLFLAATLGMAQDVPDNQPKVKKEDVSIIDKETGKKIPGMSVKEIRETNRRFIKEYNSKAHFSFDGMQITDKDGKRVPLKIDRVTLIEYWSKEGNRSNTLWEEARELEQKYKDQKDSFQVISINYDQTFDRSDGTRLVFDNLKQNGKQIPEHLYFDLLDSFREKVMVPGPVTYFLIDNRFQLISAGRGDFGITYENVFKEIDNAILNFKEDGMVDYEKINEKK